MNSFLPAGRLSKVEENGIVIQIQTEFSRQPKPRVTTSVCLDGVTLHKVQKTWEAPLETGQQQTALEKFINRQHYEVVSTIESQKRQFIQRQKSRSAAVILQEIVAERGINAAWCLTERGIISPDSGGRELLPEYKGIFEGLVSLCSLLSEISTVGEAVDGEIVLQEDLLVVLRRNSRYFIIGYDNGQKPAAILARVNSILEQS